MSMNITIYTAANCQASAITLRKLVARNIPYRLIRLENEPTIAQHLKSRGLAKTPVVEVSGSQQEAWDGYQPQKIEALAISLAHQ